MRWLKRKQYSQVWGNEANCGLDAAFQPGWSISMSTLCKLNADVSMDETKAMKLRTYCPHDSSTWGVSLSAWQTVKDSDEDVNKPKGGVQ